MLGLSGWELLLVAFVLVVVVGPKQMPPMLRAIRATLGKAQDMAREFQDALLDAADVDSLRDAGREIGDSLDGVGRDLRDSGESIGGSIMEPAIATPPKSKSAGRKSKSPRKAKAKSGKKKATTKKKSRAGGRKA